MKYLLTILAIALPCQAIFGQAVVNEISLRGIQIGAATNLTIKGRGIKKGSRVVLPFKFQQKTIEANGSNLLSVSLTANEAVSPGVYALRVVNEDGISNPILIGVDRLPHKPFESTKQELPVALTGKIAGAKFAKTSFSAKKDQIVILECEANRFGSKLRPVIRVYDSRGKQVAFSQPMRSLGGDARCKLLAPEDGEYFVEVHDFSFRGASPGFFQLKIGEFDFADICLPIGVKKDSKSVLRMIKHGLQSEFLAEQSPNQIGWNSAAVGNATMFSGARPIFLTSNLKEFVETKQADEPTLIGDIPLAINGRIEKAREIDRYIVNVTPNSKLRFDLIGRRIHSPVDARITLRNEAGNVLAANDDRSGQPDALLDYTVPGNLKKLIVEVSDITAQGSKSNVYRLSIVDQSTPGITATVPDSSFNIAKNSNILIPVAVTRQNYSGEVQINLLTQTADSLAVSGNRIAANSDLGLLTVSNNSDSPQDFTLTAVIKADGKNVTNDIVAEVRAPETSMAKGFSVFRKQLVAAPIHSKQLDVQWLTPVGSLGLLNGGQLKTNVILKKSPNLKGIVRLRMITNQRIPKKRIRKDNKDTFVDDLERVLRAETVEFKEEQHQGEVIVNVPADLPNTVFDAVLVAELLSADKKSVVLSTSTKTQTLRSRVALEAKLTNGKSLALPKSGSAELNVAGTVTRNGINAMVRVSIDGLPKGITVAPFDLPATQSEFKTTFSIPVNAELLKLTKLSLNFTAIDSENPKWAIARTKPITVKVKLAPAPKNQKTDSPKK